MVQKNTLCSLLIFALLTMSQGTVLADVNDETQQEDGNRALDVSAGYYWASTDDSPGRAAEYKFLEDSPTFGLVLKQTEENLNFSLDGDFLNDNDYYLEGSLDYKTLLRVRARTERMYHNLDHIPYQDHPEARPPATATEIEYQDLAPGVDYGRKITIDEIKVRTKMPTYPAHLNFSYWRMEKKGKEQLRFVDESCAGACHMQSTTRKVDRVTEEITAGFDAHLGPADIAFLQTLREFREKENSPADNFNGHGLLGRPAGEYVHDKAPDSKLSESTFMINLPQSGGFVSSASYTLGKRENQSNLDGGSRKDPETDYQKLAADVSYTPAEELTVNFRYRMLDLDSDSPATLTEDALAFNFISNPIPVRESIDIERNNYAAFVSYRPSRKLTLKGEFEYEDTDRNNTGIGQHSSFAGITNPNWAVPGNEETSRLRLTFFSRLLEKSALKLNGWYEYTTVDNPAYGTSLSDSNELFFSASYKPSATWGATGSIDILRGENDDRTVIQFDDTGSQVPYDTDRDEESENLALGLWFIPSDIVSIDFNYGWLHSKIDQDVLFGSEPDPNDPGGLSDYTILDDNADFEQKVHTLSAGINLRIIETVNCRLEGYHIRSHSEYSPDFNPRDLSFGLATPDMLDDISEVDIRQNGVKARIRWKLSEMLTAGFEYTFDDYEDQNSNVFDGSAQTFIASLTGAF